MFQDEHGYFAYCPALEGCVTQGESYEETIENAKEAVSLYLSTMSEDDIKQVVPFHGKKALHPKIVKQVIMIIEKAGGSGV